METLLWILVSGLLMSVLALSGALTLILPKPILDGLLLPMVAFAAGSLIGGAFFHLLPEAFTLAESQLEVFVWVFLGFTAFFLLEHFLQWHHTHEPPEEGPRPEAYLILLGDGLHNLLGGLAVGAAFILDVRLGVSAWIAAAAHEIPQELGDFAILVHGGFPRRRALALNFASAATFTLGGLFAFAVAGQVDISPLIPFAAGNFLYIAASDLIPEIKARRDPKRSLIHLTCFALGSALLWALASLGV